MPERLYTSKEAIAYLGLSVITFKRYMTDPNFPDELKGTKVTTQQRVFTQSELDRFKAYLIDNPVRPRGRQPRQQPVITTQRVADGIKALVLAKKPSPDRRRASMDAIQGFEVLAFYPTAFDENCPSFDIAPDGSVTFTGSGKLIDAVVSELAAYAQAVQG